MVSDYYKTMGDDIDHSKDVFNNGNTKTVASDPTSYESKLNTLFDDIADSSPKEKEGSDPLQLYEHDIRRFVDAMKYKLRKNAHKGRWENIDHDAALVLLEREVDELREALREGNMVEIMLEAADVANFAMMIAVMSIER